MANFARAQYGAGDAVTLPDGPEPLLAPDPSFAPGAASACRVQFYAHDGLTPELITQWHAVVDDCADANVFARPWMVAAGWSAFDRHGAARVAMVFDPDQRLIGVLPLMVGRLAGRLSLSAVIDWSHANAFLSAVTIRQGAEQSFWQTLIPALPTHAPGARSLAITALPAAGTAFSGLKAAASAMGLPLAVDRRTVRAMLNATRDADAYWREAVRPKKRKELRRQWNRLQDLGTVELDMLAADADATPWIDEFLTLEASGWKGAAGSALASAPDTHGFFRDALLAAQDHRALCFSALRIDGRAVAMLITLIDRDAGFSFKTAYDEGLAQLSPGVLIQRETLALLAARNLEWIDSCAAQNHPMIDSLWLGRREIVQISLPLPGLANRLAFAGRQSATAAWHRIKLIGSRSRGPLGTAPFGEISS